MDDALAFSAACHVDLDAWFASWAPFGAYGVSWAKDKDVLFGDAGQIWLNTGVLCARPTAWAVAFFEKVVNARDGSELMGPDEIAPLHRAPVRARESPRY